jgi:nucleotide-binding universal stress UspA family protein
MKMKVLVPLDDSPSSDRALNELLRRHYPQHIQFKLLGVVEPLCFKGEPQENYRKILDGADATMQRHFEHLLDKARTKLHDHYPAARVQSEIRHGKAAEQIVEAAKEWHADKIMMGAHGHESCPHFLPGSASKAVARKAPCTVEILRYAEPVPVV